MEKKNIHSILQDALEEKIPSSEVKLLPAIKASLVSGKHQQGEKMNIKPSRKIPRIAFVTVMLMALLTVALITPPGRAFAQSILQFFKRADSQVIPLREEQIVSPQAVESSLTAEPPAPLLDMIEAEISAGFDPAELPLGPQGFKFIGVMATKGSISIQYEAIGGGGALIINESINNGFMQSEWDQAPAEFISAVRINELDGEMVQGTYVVYPGDTSARWNPDAPVLRLRWLDGGIWFEMAKFGDVESISYLDQNGLIQLAESLTHDPFPLEVKDAEAWIGFDVLEPVALPQDMTFLGASLDPVLSIISLSFGYSDEDRRILIKQQPVDSAEACDLCGIVGPSASVQSIDIGNVKGEYAEGVWELTESGAIWRDNPYLKTIRWQKNEIAFELIYMGMKHEKVDLIRVAESLK
jgi:hypothetical protein